MSTISRPQAPSRRDLLGLAAILGVALVKPAWGQGASVVQLTPAEMDLIGEVAEVIIPTTDTPGAKAAGVAEFARMMVCDWFAPEEAERFVSGLRGFSTASQRRFGKNFLALTPEQKHDLVGGVLGLAEAAPTGSGKPPFIVLMKRLTIAGYYTSEVGASEELDLNLVPGIYDPCAHAGPDTHAGSIDFRNPAFSAN